jgi:hypothetical protein
MRVEKVDRFRIETLSLFFPAGKADETLPSGQVD